MSPATTISEDQMTSVPPPVQLAQFCAIAAIPTEQVALKVRYLAIRSPTERPHQDHRQNAGMEASHCWTVACGQFSSIASGSPHRPMPLWMSSDGRDAPWFSDGADQVEDLAGDVAIETADDLAFGLAFGGASLQESPVRGS
ncbi:hypothetical protein Acsp03_62660 [Actinomadura sp. NBRC 104412]|uniref:hypothetical protein n=1 Tax=Actinomadura sp. NBRC 104412 TaxID=3032203 RepID=UPI0024A3CFC9|nr:hypothetical protein [Actinomadura sp. NBRC 104412]GLZ08800.1 hypothetical protein Acsp03_62660 [Actinomadura sp. NBRC 104412]